MPWRAPAWSPPRAGAGGTSGAETPSAASTPAGSAGFDPTLRFSNWPGYIDVSEDGSPTTLELFAAETGIEVAYTEDINDGQEFYAKVRTELEGGRDIGRDIVVFSEETAQLFIEEGFAAPLDYGLIPNAANLLPRLQEASFDPGRRYTLPWQSGFTGLGWNTPLLRERLGVDTLTSLDQFFDPRLAGRVSILSETMDTMGLLLAWQGFDPVGLHGRAVRRDPRRPPGAGRQRPDPPGHRQRLHQRAGQR